jgi:hypothetical protein
LRLLICALLPLAAASYPRYTTWDEPWHEDVVRNADSFVKLQVLTNDAGKKVTAKVIDRMAGGPVPDLLIIDDYSMLVLRSQSSDSDETHLPLRKDQLYYVFLAKAKQGENFAIATPTAGWAAVQDGKVTATYRHSYHKALVPEALYRETQKAIFLSLHGSKHDDAAMQKTMRTWLQQKPGKLSDDSAASQDFFCQHVALECFYYFGNKEDLPLLEPFLKEDSMNAQISAVRALSRIDTEAARARLFAFLTGDGTNFAKVMAVWGLRRLGAREYLDKLVAFLPKAPEKETGFGGSIMDPRVGTVFPRSVKAAVQALVEEWRKPAKDGDGK